MNKTDKEGIIVMIALFITIICLIIWIVESVNKSQKEYEYAINGEIYKSHDCFIKKDVAYCERNGKNIRVDNYYEK